MEWSDDLSLGNDFLDKEHKGIIQLVNGLLDYRDGTVEPNNKFSRLLSNLRIEMAQHFVDEERLMEQNGCPNPELTEHVNDHVLMLLTLAETRFIPKEEILNQTIPNLSEKLVSHMAEMDQAYALYLSPTT
jgi:hemerythrin